MQKQKITERKVEKQNRVRTTGRPLLLLLLLLRRRIQEEAPNLTFLWSELLPCSPAPVACMQLITHRVCSVSITHRVCSVLCQCPTGHGPAADAAFNSPRTHRTLRRRRLRRTEHALLQFLLQLPRKLARAPPLGPRWPVQHAAQAHSECEGI